MKKDQAPTTYLLNYITTLGGTLESVFNLVAARGQLTLEQCQQQADFRREKSERDHVKDALNFLHTCGLVTREDGAYRTEEKPAEGVAFHLLLVQAIRRAPEHQADFMKIYDLLVRQGHVSLSDDDLITIMNRTEFTTPGEADLNLNKAAWWLRTSHHLGIIRKLQRSKQFLVMPEATLVLELMARAGADRQQISLMDWLKYTETECFAAVTAEGKLHPGLASVVAELAARGLIKLGIKDDVQSVSLGPGLSATHVMLVKEEAADA
ncbi:MAG TPA: hypothetical protein VD902_06665 [Symbiobacteriaceae bacterium]|nr:hypothetical protein [Symbiobacteriaceae bacterium]